MFEFHFLIKAPSCTDWIQAIGSIGALIGVAFSIWKLVKKDEQKQEQISKLTELVGKIDTQNEILMEQLKISIIPFFKKKDDFQLVGSHGLILALVNYGDIALNVQIEASSDTETDMNNSIILQYDLMNKTSFIDKMSTLNVNIRRIMDFSLPFLNIPYCFKVTFSDRINNQYFQIIRGIGYSYDISEPKKVE